MKGERWVHRSTPLFVIQQVEKSRRGNVDMGRRSRGSRWRRSRRPGPLANERIGRCAAAVRCDGHGRRHAHRHTNRVARQERYVARRAGQSKRSHSEWRLELRGRIASRWTVSSCGLRPPAPAPARSPTSPPLPHPAAACPCTPPRRSNILFCSLSCPADRPRRTPPPTRDR